MEGDTRAEEKFSRKYTVKHKQSHIPDHSWYKNNSQNVNTAHPNDVNKICDKDQIRHKAADFTVSDDLYEKTAAPRYRYFWEERDKCNPQKHQSNATPLHKEDIPKCICLPDIYEHLYLGNIHVAETYFKYTAYQFDIIINLSGDTIPKGKGVKIYNFQLEDKAHAVIEQKMIDTIMNILENAELNGLKVLIHCMAGTNRSPFFVVLYALRKNPSEEKLADRVNWWIEYVDKCKTNAGYKNWDTLTNRSYVNRLLCQKL